MFERKDITKLVQGDITENHVLARIIKNYDAFIAGGAALALSKGISISEHVSRNGLADIDVYFRKKEDYEDAVSKICDDNSVCIEKSVTGMCHNICFTRGLIGKIQLVGCVFGDPHDVVKTFDFKNLEVFCFRHGGKFYLSSSFHAKSLPNMLDIRHSRSPFLMHRICKYLKYRGYEGVTDKSKEHITDWIIKASSGYYNENTDGCPSIYVDLLDNYTVKSMLQNAHIFTDENLIYMIGKVKEDVYEKSEKYIDYRGYTRQDTISVRKRDLIAEEIKRRAS